MNLVRTILVIGMLALWSHLALAAVAAAVSGTVTVATGRGIRATLRIQDLSTPRIAGHKPFDHQFASNADGKFSLAGVPAGKYRICVEAPNENVLDPCLWSQNQQTYTVTDGAALSNLAIKVQVGSALHVHVNDPQVALPQTHGGVHGAALSMAVVTNQRKYYNLRLLSTSAGGSDHYVIVPFEENVLLVAESVSLSLSDQENKPLPGNSQRVPVRVPAGGNAPTVVLNVAKK